MDTLIVILIVVAAALYVGRTYYQRFVRKDGCACGCSGCDAADTCEAPEAPSAREPSQD